MKKEKLKTLKENFFEKDEYLVWLIERFKEGKETFERILNYIYQKNRVESMEWVKRMRNYEALPWKKFFNLTEEDLK